MDNKRTTPRHRINGNGSNGAGATRANDTSANTVAGIPTVRQKMARARATAATRSALQVHQRSVKPAPKVNQAPVGTPSPAPRVQSVTTKPTQFAYEKPVATSPKANKAKKDKKVKKDKKNKPKKKSNIYLIIVCSGVLIAIVIGIVAALLFKNGAMQNQSEGDDITSETTNPEAVITPEEEEQTKDVIEKYAEVAIDGYQASGDDSANNAVVVRVKNTSQETTSLAIVIAAMDNDGNVLDTSSIYAEDIQPGETHTFNTFVFTELTPEQLKSATFKAYKASTYEATHDGGETIEAIPPEEAQP